MCVWVGGGGLNLFLVTLFQLCTTLSYSAATVHYLKVGVLSVVQSHRKSTLVNVSM